MKSHIVAVYGATGHTGRFVATELERRGITVRRVARAAPEGSAADPAGRTLVWNIAACDQPDMIDRALQGTDAVINCAGPFLETAAPLIEAALRVGVHYLDLAAEQRSVRQSLATYHDEAQQKGIVVIPAMAFYGGLADLLVGQLCQGLTVIDEILIGVALSFWHPTAGTRRTGERNTARRFVVSGGRFSPLPASPPRRYWQFPPPFGELGVSAVPLSEIVTISRHIAAGRVESFLNAAPLADLNSAQTPPPSAADQTGRSAQTFVMDVFVTGDGQSRRLAAFGRDIYAVSAPLIVEGCMRVLSQSHRAGGGCFAPAQFFDPADFLSSLTADIRLESMGQLKPLYDA